MLREKVFSVVAVLLITCASFAATPKTSVPDQKIIAPTEVDSGEVIVAKVSPITNPPSALAKATYKWKVFELGYNPITKEYTLDEKLNTVEWPDGTSIFFGAGNQPGKKYALTLSASYLFKYFDKDGKVLQDADIAVINQMQFVTVKGAAPAPVPVPPGPGPAPNPTPVPDGKFKLGSVAYTLVTTQVAVADRKVTKDIATAFDGIAASIRAGTLTQPADILTKTKEATNAKLTAANLPLTSWDAFGTGLQKALYQLYKDKKLNAASDYADAWGEIATGLRAVPVTTVSANDNEDE